MHVQRLLAVFHAQLELTGSFKGLQWERIRKNRRAACDREAMDGLMVGPGRKVNHILHHRMNIALPARSPNPCCGFTLVLRMM
jgi:hypothetical protein